MPFEHEQHAQPVAPVADATDPTGAPLGTDALLALQRTAGNRAVGRAIERGLIQPDGTAAGRRPS